MVEPTVSDKPHNKPHTTKKEIEMIEMKYDRSTLTRCICEIADHVLETYEKKYPGDDRPRKAIEAARKVADDVTSYAAANAAYAAAYDAYTAAYDAYAADAAAAYAAYAAANTAAYAVDAAARTAYAAYAAASDAADAEERVWQADCVRRYFPASPFLMAKS